GTARLTAFHARNGAVTNAAFTSSCPPTDAQVRPNPARDRKITVSTAAPTVLDRAIAVRFRSRLRSGVYTPRSTSSETRNAVALATARAGDTNHDTAVPTPIAARTHFTPAWS